MNDDAARCDIHLPTWEPPAKPASCKLTWGQGLRIPALGGAGFVCAGDTALDPDNQPLLYGQSDVIGSLICSSAAAGITCRNHAGDGFFISRTSYRTF